MVWGARASGFASRLATAASFCGVLSGASKARHNASFFRRARLGQKAKLTDAHESCRQDVEAESGVMNSTASSVMILVLFPSA